MNTNAVLKLVDIKTLTAGFLPVLLGSAYALYAYKTINVLFMIVLAVAVALIQASTNMLNDFFDYKRGADGTDKSEEKALVSGELSSRQVLILIASFVLAALLLGLYVASRTSWAVMLVALAGGAVSFLYSYGPRSISYTPFGELAAGVTMGFGITSTVVFIQSGHFSWRSVIIAIPTVLFIAYIMFTNNLCDLEKDNSAGRHTLPGLLGFKTSKTIWLLCCSVLVFITVVFVIIGIYPLWTLIGVALLLNYRAMRDIWSFEQAQFQKSRMMGLIGKLGIEYHVLIILGLIVAHIVRPG